MPFNEETIKRLCSIPPKSGVGESTIHACGHPSLRFKLPSEHCNYCVTASMQSGHAIEMPQSRSATTASIKEA